MIFLESFNFLTRDEEDDFFFVAQRMNCYDSFYPYRVLSRHQFEQIDFEPVTILYGGNGREYSNDESALMYFADKIKEKGLYFLDEPENSLSPEKQLELADFLSDSARFYDCQLVIATHSPFILSIKGAKVCDLDEERVDVKNWTELHNVRAYYDFFKKFEDEFR